MSDNERAFSALRLVIQRLLGPGGCPWDQEQTPLSLCDYITEECFELVDAIRGQDEAGAREELGDVFFLLLFVAQLYESRGAFTLVDALEEGAAKMVRRHPHVFSDTQVSDLAELFANWERIKREEKAGKGEEKPGVFASLPRGLPALLKAYRIHAKAARNGFTWESDADLERQLESEHQELQEALHSGDAERIEDEYGDYLFTLVEFGRRRGVKANSALDRANHKFLRRFAAMEARLAAQGRQVHELPLAELNAVWAEVKAEDSAAT